ncbi:MAG TPA: hypothetical protein VJH87_15175 [Vicinamibacteria bacterium]|nr:hypothetical protein [Vicinamibacteria bacterium]
MEKREVEFALCVKNDDSDDLELRKIYRLLPDEKAAKDGYVRVVDESGEDYLYPESYFIIVKLPIEVQEALAARG